MKRISENQEMQKNKNSKYNQTVRLGYHGVNLTLKKDDVYTDKTLRLETILKANAESQDGIGGIEKLIELGRSNLNGLKKILEWNAEKKITFYRSSSELLPHITNQYLLKLSERDDFRNLVYPIEIFRHELVEIRDIIRENNMRITFHPGMHVVLNSDKSHVLTNSKRDIYYHTELIRYLELPETVIILHGGNLNGQKEYYRQKLIDNLNLLEPFLKKWLVLENDENSYNIYDMLIVNKSTKLPVVFDQFHHKLYYNTDEDLDFTKDYKLIDSIRQTWVSSYSESEIFTDNIDQHRVKNRRMKIHISEQNPNGRRGNHSEYLTYVPKWVFEFVEEFGEGIDIMIEAKADEMALQQLYKKYKIMKMPITL